MHLLIHRLKKANFYVDTFSPKFASDDQQYQQKLVPKIQYDFTVAAT